MAEAIVRAQVLRWVSDDQPGWIEVGLVDALGSEHRIVEKVPVLTSKKITEASEFPAEFWLAVDTGESSDEHIEVTFAHDVETTEGRLAIHVLTSDVKWL